MELFIFGFGLYGHAVYLVELQRLHGWSTTLISTASTVSFLLGSVLAAFTNDALLRLGPRRLILLGMCALAASVVLLATTTTVSQLYLAYALMSFGWMGMGTVVAATILRAWFDRRSGLAMSLAFNGATCSGIIVAPVLVLLVARIGFTSAMLTMAGIMVVILVPVVIALIRLPANAGSSPSEQAMRGIPDNGAKPKSSRWTLLRSIGFWTISAPFALALLAQVGFIVNQIALLQPAMGQSLAALAVATTTAMALIGRLCLGLVADRLDPRFATTVSLLTQAGALCAIILTDNVVGLFLACAVYGFSIGNLIALPPLIIHREFEQAAFATVLGMSTAVGGVISALGPGMVGLVRDATGGYAAPLAICLLLKLVSAAIVVVRPRQP